jgi:acyl dehydratase
MTAFARGIGGFGYKGKIRSEYPAVPKRQPDHSQEEKTQPN